MKPLPMGTKPEHVKKILDKQKIIGISAPYLPRREYVLIPVSTWQETLCGVLGGEVRGKK